MSARSYLRPSSRQEAVAQVAAESSKASHEARSREAHVELGLTQ